MYESFASFRLITFEVTFEGRIIDFVSIELNVSSDIGFKNISLGSSCATLITFEKETLFISVPETKEIIGKK